MHDSKYRVEIDSRMIPLFAGNGIGTGIKNIKMEWNRNQNQ